MVLLKNPAYRAVFEDFLALHKLSSVRLEEPTLNAPLNNFPFPLPALGKLQRNKRLA